MGFHVVVTERAADTEAMLTAQTIWLVERLHVDLGRARTMLCS
ncbi:hypothetical protein HMPREF0063_10551 [Aeromicrobium marinum DSM 15272]|uniref:Uncharacterized protein n=1 Tax=Aeromicrobium marinum DSM 15272 TaxID=585531 RepID=E2S9B1_9ACTN|nr:hypothetical protein HMPREF0063_10551 [Aeromicrobium marinum DSM 15272]